MSVGNGVAEEVADERDEEVGLLGADDVAGGDDGGHDGRPGDGHREGEVGVLPVAAAGERERRRGEAFEVGPERGLLPGAGAAERTRHLRRDVPPTLRDEVSPHLRVVLERGEQVHPVPLADEPFEVGFDPARALLVRRAAGGSLLLRPQPRRTGLQHEPGDALGIRQREAEREPRPH